MAKVLVGSYLMVLALGLHLGTAFGVASLGAWNESAEPGWGSTYMALVLIPLFVGSALMVWGVMADD